jgi:hypothetical protein
VGVNPAAPDEESTNEESAIPADTATADEPGTSQEAVDKFSPPQQTDSREPSLLLEEGDDTEDVEWVGGHGSTASDSASEVEAEEETDNSSVDIDGGFRETREQERIDAAIAALQRAWAANCTCGKTLRDFLQIVLSC